MKTLIQTKDRWNLWRVLVEINCFVALQYFLGDSAEKAVFKKFSLNSSMFWDFQGAKAGNKINSDENTSNIEVTGKALLGLDFGDQSSSLWSPLAHRGVIWSWVSGYVHHKWEL